MGEVGVIINADDLGMSQSVNDSTFKLIQSGHVTSATMMANSPFIEEACDRALLYPGCSFGAHLNVTEFFPLTGSGKLEPLLDDERCFNEEKTRETSVDALLAEGIFAELCAQIDKLISLGIAVEHFDSHHHIHTLPRLFLILKKLQKKYQIRKVRITRNIYSTHENVSKKLWLKKSAFNFALRHYYQTNTTQGFTDFKTFVEQGTRRRLKYRNVEIMVHPGSSVYEDESDALAEPWNERMEFPVKLINYRDIS